MSDLLLNEIRATKPEAPSALRERVRALAEQEPARMPFLARFEWRRFVLVVPAAAMVAIVAAGVIGLSRDDSRPLAGEVIGSDGGTTAVFESAPVQRGLQRPLRAVPPAAGAADSAIVPPVPGQLQRFEAELRLRVDDVEALSDATKRAQRIALQHGGSVASLQYDAPAEGVGAAQLTLRVPTVRVQSAMAQLAQLGTILGQRYGIEDLQVQADTLQAQIEQTQRQIAQLVERLSSTSLSAADRVVLQSRLGNAREKLKGLREGLKGTKTEARTATIFLTLTTEEIHPEAVGGSRLDDVKDVLAWEGIAVLYALVVAGPFILLGLLVWLALRLRRRQVETRLLEQN